MAAETLKQPMLIAFKVGRIEQRATLQSLIDLIPVTHPLTCE